jgi:hypothetical protein
LSNSAPALSLEEYQKHIPYMMKALYSVHNQIGGDLEEMKASLWLLYDKACRFYRPAAGKAFKAYLYKVVWDDTYAARRIEVNRKAKHPMRRISDKFDMQDRARFSFPDFLSELSQEAAGAVLVALEPPDGVKYALDGTPKARSVLKVVREHFNWSSEQLHDICNEIREALR